MLNKIKGLKVQAMKDREEGKIAKDAYTAVLSSLDYARGKGTVIDDAAVLAAVKKEIKVFNESVNVDSKVVADYRLKAVILEKLLPAQLSHDQMAEKLTLCPLDEDGKITPKSFMKYLDDEGFAGAYDTGLAAKLARK